MKITLDSKFLLAEIVGSKEEIESAHNVLFYQNLTSWEKYHICIQFKNLIFFSFKNIVQ